MNTFRNKTHHLKSVGKRLLCASAILLGLSTQEASAQWVKIGSGTTDNTSTSYPTPYGNANKGQRAQYLYKKADMDAAGLKKGWITDLGFYVTNTNGSSLHTGLKFYVGGTTKPFPTAPDRFYDPTLPAATATLKEYRLRYFDPVLSPIAAAGWNDFHFSEPFYWNGTDDIVVGTCFWSGIGYKNASVENSVVGYTASHTYVEPSSSTLGLPICDLVVDGTVITFDKTLDNPNILPNIRFNNVISVAPGKPDAGRAVSSTKTFCIKSGDSIILTLADYVLADSLSFQWQKTTNMADLPWTNLVAAKTTEISARTVQAEPTYYRCIVTSLVSGLKDTSNYVLVGQAPPFECDCSSYSADNTQEKVLRVALSTIDNTTPCSVSGGFYSDFTTKLAAAELEPVL